MRFHCLSLEASSDFSSFRSPVRVSCSRLSSISSSLRKERSRMLRIASAWISVSLKARISAGFGSSFSRMILITLSRLR